MSETHMCVCIVSSWSLMEGNYVPYWRPCLIHSCVSALFLAGGGTSPTPPVCPWQGAYLYCSGLHSHLNNQVNYLRSTLTFTMKNNITYKILNFNLKLYLNFIFLYNKSIYYETYFHLFYLNLWTNCSDDVWWDF